MQFSRIVTFFTAFMALSFLVLGSPASGSSAVKRAQSAENIVNTLQSQTSATLAQIQSSPQTTDALQPLMQQLIDQIGSATSDISSLSTRSLDLDKRQLDEVVGAIVAGIIIDVATVLSGIPIIGLELAFLLVSVDAALGELITGLNVAVAGLLAVVGGLVVTVEGLLRTLGFTVVLTVLGIA